jgi:pyrroloquinoline-quinone synthase
MEGYGMSATEKQPWSEEEFLRQLRHKGAGYHFHHPFEVMLREGKLNKEQIQGWVANRYYYQKSIPLKDGAVLSNCPDREVRRQWILRILDQDGTQGNEGGNEAWIRLGEACGLRRDELENEVHVLPGVRFAVDAYVNFARTRPWQEAVCSSLTELFAPDAHAARLEAFPKYYPWIARSGLAYFSDRLTQARRDVDHGLRVTLDYFKTRPQQERALEILQFKLNVLWTMLDAMYLTYVLGERQRVAASTAAS